jgi:hypothetical protein
MSFFPPVVFLAVLRHFSTFLRAEHGIQLQIGFCTLCIKNNYSSTKIFDRMQAQTCPVNTPYGRFVAQVEFASCATFGRHKLLVEVDRVQTWCDIFAKKKIDNRTLF